MFELNKIYCGNNLDLFSNLENDTIHLIVTSPPYSNIRKYNGFDWNFQKVAQEMFRVLVEGGIIAWVVGDQYLNGSRDLQTFRQGIYFKDICGFNIHDIIIYQKSGFNFPANNRYHQVWESILVLSKGKPRVFNPICDRKNAYPGQKPHGRHRGHDENDYVDMSKVVKTKPAGEYGKRTNVWYVKVGGGHVTDDKFAHKHPAIFPDSLAGDLIKSYSNQDEIVLDPFNGSGTTTKMAKLLKRKFLGFEISKEYCDLANLRLTNLEQSQNHASNHQPELSSITR